VTQSTTVAVSWRFGIDLNHNNGFDGFLTGAQIVYKVTERPNILLVTTDSHGWNTVSVDDNGFVDTPNIRRLAEEGVTFERSYASAPVCGPSRAGIYTGQYAHVSGAWTNGLSLQSDVSTIGERLQDQGYRTAYVGKWHLDGEYMGDGEAPPGYESEYWYDARNYRDDIGEELWEWYRSGMDTRVSENDIDEIHERGITRGDTWAGNITDTALSFLNDAQDDDRPFFLAVNYDEPHEPSLCPPPFCDMYRDERYPLPDNYETAAELGAQNKPERQREFAAAYADGNCFMNSLQGVQADGGIYRPLYFGCVEFVDDEMGRLLDAVSDDETLVTFTADHGHYLGAHGLDLKHFALYDEVINVPLVMRGPSLPEGALTDALVSHVDLVPTFLEIVAESIPSECHGESFLDTARNPSQDHRDVALIEHNGYGQARTDGDGFYPVRGLVSADGYKLCLNLLESDELYDLQDDPGEVRNRINESEHAERRDDLHDRLLAEMSSTEDPFHGQAWADREWRDVADTTHPG